jgi:hypothetical protein
MPEALAHEDAMPATSPASSELSTDLPTLSEFLKLVADEEKEVVEDLTGYSVYHKYSKGC